MTSRTTGRVSAADEGVRQVADAVRQVADATAGYLAYLRADGGLVDELDLTPLDPVGVPVRFARWRQDGAELSGIGYGADGDRARVGALGEAAEFVGSWRYARSHPARTTSCRRLLGEDGPAAVQDPRDLGTDAGVAHDPAQERPWTRVRRLADGSPVWVPAEYVAGSGSELAAMAPGRWPRPLVTPVSNGRGAGATPEQALAHGLLELFQRDGNGLAFRALDRGRVLDPATVSDPVALDVLQAMRRCGIDVLLKVGSTDWDLPNVYAVGRAPGDDLVVATACGEAVHPDRDVAVRKALLELASSRVRKRFQHGPLDALRGLLPDDYVDSAAGCVDLAAEEQRVLDATVRWLTDPPEDWPDLLDRTLFRRDTVEPVTSLPTAPAGDPASVVADLVRRLTAEGREVLVADLASWDGGHVVKVLVPGLEVETVAYGRIGERNAARLLAEGRDDVVRRGARPGERWQEVQLTPDAVDRLGGPVWLDPAGLARLTADLLPLYREPGRHAAPVAVARGHGAATAGRR